MPTHHAIEQQFDVFTRYMPPVDDFSRQLEKLQAVWDSLSLLGQLSGVGHEMGNTRESFFQLSQTLLQHLSREHGMRVEQNMVSKAGVLVEMMQRNLFERTADIGFLATDDRIRSYLFRSSEWHQRLGHGASELKAQQQALIQEHLSAYVAKYSVYHDVILLSTKGEVLFQLTEPKIKGSQDPFIEAALTTDQAYIEIFRACDLLPNINQPLIYAYRVRNTTGELLGVICLCFDFQDECNRIFHESNDGDWSVMLLTDTKGSVIASSDPLQVPLHCELPTFPVDTLWLQRHAGRQYLSVTCAGKGYQGYQGQGWMGRIMIPLEQAFTTLPEIQCALPSSEYLTIFSSALSAIPREAEHIQHRLNRSVWNGSVQQGRSGQEHSFSRALLSEVSQTGIKTQTVFSQAIHNLYQTIIGAMIENNRFLASLAVNIMDRNLYERANDCRWWAMTDLFRQTLSQPEITAAGCVAMAKVLAYINDLYTVYTGLVLFDREGKVRAVSKQHLLPFVGQHLNEPWVSPCLALTDSQHYVVSDFNATPLYDHRPTYIYASAVMHPEHPQQAVGGIGIIFDSEPQFAAMLQDASPKSQQEKDVFALFFDDQQRVIASTHPELNVGSQVPSTLSQAAINDGEVIACGDHLYAIGLSQSTGYREYKSEQDSYHQVIHVAMLKRIGQQPQQTDDQPNQNSHHWQPNLLAKESYQEMATFCIGHQLCALPVACIVEAIDLPELGSQAHGNSVFAGFVPYEQKALPVLDISHYLTDSSMPAQQLIVLKLDDIHLGMLVGDLGSVVKLPHRSIIPVQAQLNAIIDALVERDNDMPPLYVLSVSAMHRITVKGLAEASNIQPVSVLEILNDESISAAKTSN